MDISTCAIQDIAEAENTIFTQCLGLDLYEDLKDDVVDYSSADVWAAVTYNLDDIVIYDGLYYKATATTTEEPTYNEVDWVLADKFNTELYNTLWCYGLGKLLALNVAYSIIPLLSLHISDNGLVKKVGVDFEHASQREGQTYLEYLRERISDLKDLMDTWIRANNDGGEFDNYKPLLDEAEVSCTETDNCSYTDKIWIA